MTQLGAFRAIFQEGEAWEEKQIAEKGVCWGKGSGVVLNTHLGSILVEMLCKQWNIWVYSSRGRLALKM